MTHAEMAMAVANMPISPDFYREWATAPGAQFLVAHEYLEAHFDDCPDMTSAPNRVEHLISILEARLFAVSAILAGESQ